MIISMVHTIKMIEHSIRIYFGDSTETYGGKDWRLKSHGSIQDNGASPMIWAAISTVLFLAIKEKNYDGIFRAPIINLLTQLASFAFVDDTDLLQTQRYSNETIDDIVDELQGSLDTWKGTLNASRGALNCDDLDKGY